MTFCTGKRRLFGAYSKYNVPRVKHAGRSFGSQLEADLFDILCLMEKAGEIKDIKQQDHVELTEALIKYIPDYRVTETSTGKFVWHEAKGIETDVWTIKRRLWQCYGPGELNVWVRSGRCGVRLKETIVPGG